MLLLLGAAPPVVEDDGVATEEVDIAMATWEWSCGEGEICSSLVSTAVEVECGSPVSTLRGCSRSSGWEADKCIGWYCPDDDDDVISLLPRPSSTLTCTVGMFI